MHFSKVQQGHSKVVRLHRSFPAEIARFGLGFRHQVAPWAHSTATTVRLWRVINRPGTVVFTPGSLPRTTCVPVAASPTTLFPIGVAPEVSPLTPMSTAGAGKRRITAAKETCSGTN